MGNKIYLRLAGSSLAIISGTIAIDQVNAQTAATPAGPAATAASPVSDSDGEIVVTSRKRAESIVDNPTSVTAVTAEQIAAKGITGYRQLNNFVPNFRWQTQNGSTATRVFNSFVIRGISGDTPDRANVSVFIDGISVGGGGSIPGLTDISQVEVVKGPQSAYFGRSTFAGAINFVTAPPSFDFKGSADISLGSHLQQEFKAAVEGGVIKDLLALRVSARRGSTGSFDHNFGYGGDLGEQTTNSYSIAALLTPAPNFTMRAYHTGWRDNDAPNATAFLYAPDFNCRNGTATTLNYICGEISRLSTDRISQNITKPYTYIAQYRAIDILGSDFIKDYGLQRRATFSSAAFDYKPMDVISIDGNLAYVNNRFAQMQDSAQRYETTPNKYAINLTAWHVRNKLGELRASADPIRGLHLIAGFNYFWQTAQVAAYTHTIVPGRADIGPSINLNRITRTRNIAGFGALNYEITRQIEVDLEGRYQSENVKERGLLSNGITISGQANKFLPRAILKYKFSPTVNIYGSYSLGTRGPVPNTNFYSLSASAQAQINAQIGQVPTVVPEEVVRMYEAGFKGEFFDRRLLILASGYWGVYDHRQINQTLFYNDAAGNPAQAILTVANGKTNLSGIELQTSFKLTPELTLEGTYGYARSEIARTNDAAGTSIIGNSNPVGNRTPLYPAVTASGGVSYHHQLTQTMQGYARADYIYTGKIYADVTNLLWLKPSNVVNATIGITNGRFTYEIWGRNIFDNKVPANIARTTDVYTGQNAVTESPQERPSVGMRVAMQFR